jgi:hypothetical protein
MPSGLTKDPSDDDADDQKDDKHHRHSRGGHSRDDKRKGDNNSKFIANTNNGHCEFKS